MRASHYGPSGVVAVPYSFGESGIVRGSARTSASGTLIVCLVHGGGLMSESSVREKIYYTINESCTTHGLCLVYEYDTERSWCPVCALAAERETCAKLAESMAWDQRNDYPGPRAIAAAIRGRNA